MHSHLHICVMSQQLSSKDLWMHCIIDTIFSAKFCRCHHVIVIYRHACQHQDSLSSFMAIAKCGAKTCAAEAEFHHTGCLRKHFQKHCECLSVYTLPILLPFHSKWIFIRAGRDLTASTYYLNFLLHSQALRRGELHPQFRLNQPHISTTLGVSWLNFDWWVDTIILYILRPAKAAAMLSNQ